MEYVTIRQTNLTNSTGNDMGKVAEGVHYIVASVTTKIINGINRMLVSTNRYVPVADVTLVTVTPPPPPDEPPAERERMIIQYSNDNGVTWITDADEIWERVS